MNQYFNVVLNITIIVSGLFAATFTYHLLHSDNELTSTPIQMAA